MTKYRLPLQEKTLTSEAAGLGAIAFVLSSTLVGVAL